MNTPQAKWQIVSASEISEEFIEKVQSITGKKSQYCTQLLWQRGVRDSDKLAGFLNPALYKFETTAL